MSLFSNEFRPDNEEEVEEVAAETVLEESYDEQYDESGYEYVPISPETKQFILICAGMLLAFDHRLQEVTPEMIMITMASFFFLETLLLTIKNNDMPILGPLKEYSRSGAVLSAMNVMLRAWGGYVGTHAAIDVLTSI